MSLKSIYYIVLATVVLLVSATGEDILADKPEPGEIEIYVYAEGVTAGDEARLKDLLKGINGISKIEIEDIEGGVGEVEIHVSKDVSQEAIKKSIEDGGYKVTKIEVED